jgi:hypothetical protein
VRGDRIEQRAVLTLDLVEPFVFGVSSRVPHATRSWRLRQRGRGLSAECSANRDEPATEPREK